ncbi:hypothetical protein Fmac_019483 [Flemingia macrophylla]|uniref:poly(A)-specific ribonuclease n=1 Tax=Flemingia macrophylla TaxID=520843 RepID=A0ABD1M7W9_9FABA
MISALTVGWILFLLNLNLNLNLNILLLFQMAEENPNSGPIEVREVWASNLDSEFEVIGDLVDDYNFISMDTEFPGLIFRPTKPSLLRPADHYRFLKSNVDALNLIQVGLTLSDARGNLPRLRPDGHRVIWEFNFRDFDAQRHAHSPDSLDLLRRQGIDFARNAAEGVESRRFAELMMSSGLVCNEGVSWVTFHSAYDFGYLVKILSGKSLPHGLEQFLETLRAFFGNNVYDIKHLMRFCDTLYGGLDRLARTLNVHRAVGKSHQAGSDSLLTWHAFQKLRDSYFLPHGPHKHAGVLFGFELLT